MNDTFILKQPLSSDTESLLLKISHTCTESGIAFLLQVPPHVKLC